MSMLLASWEAAAVREAARCLLCLKRQNGKAALETSQLKNLLEAAIACRDVRSLVTWVLYQVGRSKPDRDWRNSGQGGVFGDAVVKALTVSLRDCLPPDKQANDCFERLEIARIFAGQLSRLHTYAENVGSWAPIELLAGGGEA